MSVSELLEHGRYSFHGVPVGYAGRDRSITRGGLDVDRWCVQLSMIGRWAVVRKSAWKSNFVATPWGIDFLCFSAQYHRCSITTKSFQAKNLPNTEKMGDQWFPLLNCIQLQQKWPASSERLQKIGYKSFKQFFYISNCFRVIRCQKRVFNPVPSPSSDILVQFSHLKQQ
jgi:hypothetical protein